MGLDMFVSNVPASAFRRNMRWIRVARGLTQAQLAARLGLPRPCITRWESDVRTPSLENIVKIADALDVSLDILFGRYSMDRKHIKSA